MADEKGCQGAETNPRASTPARVDLSDVESWPVLLTTEQVAVILQVTVATVRAMIRDGRLDSVRFGPRSVRVLKTSLGVSCE